MSDYISGDAVNLRPLNGIPGFRLPFTMPSDFISMKDFIKQKWGKVAQYY